METERTDEHRGNREQQDRLGGVERPGAVVVEQSLEVPVLEDQDEDPEHRAQVQRVHHDSFERQHDRAGHEEQDDERGGDHDGERDREVSAEAVLEIEV